MTWRRKRVPAPPPIPPDLASAEREQRRTAGVWDEITRLARVLVPAREENRFSARISEAYRGHQG